MVQKTIDFTKRITPLDPNCDSRDVPRLAGQNAAILERLKQGSATNVELNTIALKYTSRLSDLRKHGHVIRCERIGGGVTRYSLADGAK